MYFNLKSKNYVNLIKHYLTKNNYTFQILLQNQIFFFYKYKMLNIFSYKIKLN